MLNRLRVRDWPGRKRRLEFAFYFAEVREIALHTKFFRLCSPSENHMHSLRHFALNRCYEFGIKTELNQRARLSRFRELRLHDFVGPGTELAGRFNANKEVSAPQPTAPE